jgi:hypothetical protein
MKKCLCLHCGYTWQPRIETEPKSCPYCKSPRWNELKRKGNAYHETAKAGKGKAMNREDFTEGSVGQIIFNFWDGRINKQSDFESALLECDKQSLVDFIMQAQGAGRFGGGYIHD